VRHVALVLVLLLAGAPAGAVDPPPQDSFAALVDDVAHALGEVRTRAPALALDEAAVGATAVCGSLSPHACAATDTAPCARALGALYDDLRDRARDPDAVRAGVAQHTAAGVAGLLNRLVVAGEVAGTTGCRHLATPGAHPSRLVFGDDGHTVVVEPLTPLRAGKRYAVVIDGLPDAALAAARASVAPRAANGALDVPAGTFADVFALPPGMPADGLRVDDAVAFLRRLERDVHGIPGAPTYAGLRFTLPGPPTANDVTAVRARLVPAGAAPAALALATFRAHDPRPGLGAYRAAIARAGCADTPASPVELADAFGVPARYPGTVLHGELRSLDIRADAGVARLLGAAPSAAPVVTVPFLLALPPTDQAAVPIVVAVHGHASRASDMLSAHAAGIAARGMGLLALDLPAHGERSTDPEPFLDALRPELLARNVRQAAVDVMAAVHAARTCGFRLPDGRHVVAADVRYLGYSVGGIVGAVTRAVEPDLGATVLLAPGGDLTSWMMLRVGLGLGTGFVSCVGGADGGRNCAHGPACAPPGVCEEDPALARFVGATELPYRLVVGGSDPLGFVGQPHGAGSNAPLLVVTGGRDDVLLPLLATRLADAYRVRPVAPHRRRRREITFVQWPEVGHDLGLRHDVDEQAYAFLADTRSVRRSAGGVGAPAPDDAR
jgi:hypothetical protein